jgi:outer membrane protein
MFRTCSLATTIAMVILPLMTVSCSELCPPKWNDYVGAKTGNQPPAVPLPEPTSEPMTEPSSVPASGPTYVPTTMATVSGEPLPLGVQQAILMSLANNRGFAVELYTPKITETFVDNAIAQFDPVLNGQITAARRRVPSLGLRRVGTTMVPSGDIDWTNLDTTAASLALTDFLPTGTQVTLTGSTAAINNAGPLDDVSRLELNVTQSLLRGAGCDVNLATLRQTKIDVRISQYELRGFAEALVAQTEETYWNYALAIRQIDIVEESLKLAQQQLDEVRERVKVGKLAETEIAAAEAEVALRQQAMILAKATMQTTRLQLLKLLSPNVGRMWERDLLLKEEPTPPQIRLPDVENYVKVGLLMRPDLNQARLQVERDDLELVKTRNGLLPLLNAFITLGKTGYANSFGESLGGMGQQGGDILVGLTGEYPICNRAAIANDRRATYTRDQAKAAVQNFEQLVQVDIRTAYISVIQSKEQVVASDVTVKAQKETLRAETEKFHVGKSTSFQVAQAQRDLLQSQIVEIQAVVNYLNAIVELYRLDGSLLERRGIAAPGRQPVVVNMNRR